MLDYRSRFERNGAAFATELYRQLTTGGDNRAANIVASPFGVGTCLALALEGANGKTAMQIASGMKLELNSKSELAECFQHILNQYGDGKLLTFANKVCVQEGAKIKSKYEATLKANYMAEVDEMNFVKNVAAAKQINAWIFQRSGGKITEIIASDCLNADTRFVLLNAVHFKGDWSNKFDSQLTRLDQFWLDERQQVEVEYMNQTAIFSFGCFEDLDCTALEMPYKESDLSMFVLLPNARSGLKALSQKLRDVSVLDLVEKMNSTRIIVKFPKFKADYSVELNEVLKKMDMKEMFTANADFSQMLEAGEELFVTKVLHKASIEVDEEGSEAAAATGMVMMTRMALPEFQADHPFLFMIWNKKIIFFAGAFVSPTNAVPKEN